jgi:hypothetical protein
LAFCDAKQTSVERPTDGLLLTLLLSQARLGSICGAGWASLLMIPTIPAGYSGDQPSSWSGVRRRSLEVSGFG